MTVQPLEYSTGDRTKRREALRQARNAVAEARMKAAEPGENVPMCSGKCPEVHDVKGPCEFCDSFVLQLDGSWNVQAWE